MRLPLCPGCGEIAKVWRARERVRVDKICVRLSAAKFDAACDEWSRIARSDGPA